MCIYCNSFFSYTYMSAASHTYICYLPLYVGSTFFVVFCAIPFEVFFKLSFFNFCSFILFFLLDIVSTLKRNCKIDTCCCCCCWGRGVTSLELPLGSRVGAIVEQLEGAVLGGAQIFALLGSARETRDID